MIIRPPPSDHDAEICTKIDTIKGVFTALSKSDQKTLVYVVQEDRDK